MVVLGIGIACAQRAARPALRAGANVTPAAPAAARSVLRATLKIDVAALLARVIEEFGTSDTAVALDLGISRQKVGRKRSRDDSESVSLVDVLMLAAPLRRRLLNRLVAPLGEVIVELPAAAPSRSDMGTHAAAARSAGDLLGAHAAALDDGALDAFEGETLVDLCDAVLGHVLAIRHRAAAVAGARGADRVTPIRRAG